MLNISQVILTGTDSNLCRKDLTVHWSAPNSLIRSYLQPCTNSMWGDESEAVAPIIWLYQTVDAHKGGSFLSRSSHNSPEICFQTTVSCLTIVSINTDRKQIALIAIHNTVVYRHLISAILPHSQCIRTITKWKDVTHHWPIVQRIHWFPIHRASIGELWWVRCC